MQTCTARSRRIEPSQNAKTNLHTKGFNTFKNATFVPCASPKLRPSEKSCDPPARAAGQNYLTIGRALERLGVFEPRAELWRKPAGKSNPFAGVPVLIIRQLGRSDGASRPGALETRPYPDSWTELCPPAFPFLGPGACGLRGNSEHSPTAGA